MELGLLHGGRDVAAILHQLHPVVLHYPPGDGILAGPQAAVEDVVASVHWRRNSIRVIEVTPGLRGQWGRGVGQEDDRLVGATLHA